MGGMLDQLEAEIVDRLSVIPFFATLTILAAPQKNIVDEIAVKVGKLRTVIVPVVSAADDNSPNLPGTYFDDITINVGVFQNPTIAASANDPLPREICEQIHGALKLWKPDSLSRVITARKPGISYAAQDGQLNVWNCNFTVEGGPIITLTQVAKPAASAGGGNVTLTCATAGAAIFYTTNNSNPAPRNGTLYTAPFASTGQTVKARAFLAGYLISDLRTLTT